MTKSSNHTGLQKKSITLLWHFVGFAYQGKDIVFRFIIEHGSLRDFGP
jgi:hypothetical protein